MKRKLVLIAHVFNEAVTKGFLPAGISLGYDIILLTDHGVEYANNIKQHLNAVPSMILECDVFNPIAIIDLLHVQGIEPDIVFSNSDHLQSVTALVADYFLLPSKDWLTCYRAKNKAAMRCHLANLKLPSIWSCLLQQDSQIPDHVDYPLIAKPCEGVASIDVNLCNCRQELEDYCRMFFRKNAGAVILLEGFIEGSLFTLETLGDGERIQAIGGFDVALSTPPHFVELEAHWNGTNSIKWRDIALAQIEKFGVGFGVCHSEFIATKNGPVLVEINYRSIGDGREFLLNDLLPFNWFETILNLHAGHPLPQLSSGDASAIIRYIPAISSGRVEKISNNLNHKEAGVELCYRNLKRVGDVIKLSHSNKDYLGIVTAIADTNRELVDSVNDFVQQIIWEVNT